LNKHSDQMVIKALNLTRLFGDFVAVDHVSFEVFRGEIIGYLGPNGSGKTTTIRMLLGLLRPNDGNALVLGYDPSTHAEKVREQVGYMSQKFSLYKDLTVAENLRFYAGVYGITDLSRQKEVLHQVGLTGLEHLRVGNLSVGWRQRLALATAIVHNPQLLFLDEPTSGVDPSARRAFWDLIYELVETGVSALVTTHYMDEAEYCGRVGIMRRGRLLAMDTPTNLKEDALPGLAWDIRGLPLLSLLDTLDECPFVIRAGLVSDHLRAVTSSDTIAQLIINYFSDKGFSDILVNQIEPTLEDIFLALSSDN